MRVDLKKHFQPGNIIFSDYWRDYDLVIAFHPAPADGYWSVEVVRCDANGIRKAGEHVRNHCTLPGKHDRIHLPIGNR